MVGSGPPTAPLRPVLRGEVLVVDLGAVHRCASSAVLGGGLGEVRTWLNAQVHRDYARTDPAEHLRELSRGLGAAEPVVGMLTAALVRDHAVAEHGGALAVATVGLGDPTAAAGDSAVAAPMVGTINVLVRLDRPLTDAALVGAISTATEAKAQALAEAGVRATNGPGHATGTPTDSLCVACPTGTFGGVPAEPFAGPATVVGGDLARAVRDAVLAGTGSYRSWRRAHGAPGGEDTAP
jgi:adenosylcobinamide amidohydrolase